MADANTYKPGGGAQEVGGVNIERPIMAERPRIIPAGEGMRVVMRRIKGLTDPRLLAHPFYFQVPPMDSAERQMAFSHTDYETIRAGQFSRPGARQLESFTFNSMFVADKAAWTLLDPRNEMPQWWPDPIRFVKELRRIVNLGTPFQLQAWEPQESDFDVNMAATLRSLSVRAGEPGTRYFDVTFTEYRTAALRRRRRGDLPTTLAVSNIAKGRRTLHKLAAYYYKSHHWWRVIRKANPVLAGIPPDKDLAETTVFKRNKHLKITIPVLPADHAPAPDIPSPDPPPR